MKKGDAIITVRSLLWIGVFFAAIAMVFSAIKHKETEVVVDVLVNVEPLSDGHYLINPDDVAALIENRFPFPLTDLPVGQVDIERLERVLEEDPFVDTAEAYVDAQNKVNIFLTQREPVVRIMDNNGQDYYLDEAGNQMPPSQHYAARVLAITGNLPPFEDDYLTNEKHLINESFQLGLRLREEPFLDALIEQVYVNKKGELIMAPKIGKQTILFGRYRDVEAKLNRLKVFYKEGLPYKGWNAYKSFDLRYDGQVVCVKR